MDVNSPFYGRELHFTFADASPSNEISDHETDDLPRSPDMTILTTIIPFFKRVSCLLIFVLLKFPVSDITDT